MRFRWDEFSQDARDRFLRDPSWLGDDVLLFSDEFIEWLNEFAPDATMVEMYGNIPFRYTSLSSLTEGRWKQQHGDSLSFEFPSDVGLLFKLTWL